MGGRNREESVLDYHPQGDVFGKYGFLHEVSDSRLLGYERMLQGGGGHSRVDGGTRLEHSRLNMLALIGVEKGKRGM